MNKSPAELKAMLDRPVALIVIDMQRDYCVSDGILGSLGYDVSGFGAVADGVGRLISEFGHAFAMKIFARTVFPPWPRSGAHREHYARSALARRVRPDLSEWFGVSPGAGDLVVDKFRYSAFADTNLDAVLRSSRIETVVLCGVTTDVCVDTTARDAFMRDYRVVVVSDCTAASTAERYSHALGVLDDFFARVHTSDEIRVALRS